MWQEPRAGQRGLGISQDASDLLFFLRSVVGGPRVSFPEGLTPSFSLRAPLGSEVQQDQGAPLVPQGVQAHKVPLEQRERKVSR